MVASALSGLQFANTANQTARQVPL